MQMHKHIIEVIYKSGTAYIVKKIYFYFLGH